MRVAAVQHDIVWEDAVATTARLAPQVAAAVAGGATLVVLSEMFGSGFSMAPARVAEPPDGPSTRFLVDQARTHGAWLCGSVPLRPAAGDRPVNRFTLAAPDGTIHTYDKLHPFSYAGEHEHYAAGSATVTVDVDGVRVTPFVCYDLRFANVFWERALDTDVYVVVANWPEARRDHWNALLKARAIENQAYVVAVNRVGDGDGLAYVGDSQVVAPDGEVLISATDEETILFADIDPDVVRDVRARLPFLPDRRP